jgi:hypothetical protein
MEYCPYCSAPLTKDYKTCPECKKSLSIDMLESLYGEGETSGIDVKVKRKIWFREHAHIFIPIITLIVGLVVGGLVAYSGAMAQFAIERTGYKSRIADLQKKIDTGASETASIKDTLEEQIKMKDSIIKILQEQQNIMSRIINFTRRLADNSTIMVSTADEQSFYSRNVKYLMKLYNDQTDLLKATGFEPIPNFDLESVPQFLNE